MLFGLHTKFVASVESGFNHSYFFCPRCLNNPELEKKAIRGQCSNSAFKISIALAEAAAAAGNFEAAVNYANAAAAFSRSEASNQNIANIVSAYSSAANPPAAPPPPPSPPPPSNIGIGYGIVEPGPAPNLS